MNNIGHHTLSASLLGTHLPFSTAAAALSRAHRLTVPIAPHVWVSGKRHLQQKCFSHPGHVIIILVNFLRHPSLPHRSLQDSVGLPRRMILSCASGIGFACLNRKLLNYCGICCFCFFMRFFTKTPARHSATANTIEYPNPPSYPGTYDTPTPVAAAISAAAKPVGHGDATMSMVYAHRPADKARRASFPPAPCTVAMVTNAIGVTKSDISNKFNMWVLKRRYDINTT